jgi:hypothetical protein
MPLGNGKEDAVDHFSHGNRLFNGSLRYCRLLVRFDKKFLPFLIRQDRRVLTPCNQFPVIGQVLSWLPTVAGDSAWFNRVHEIKTEGVPD